MKLISILCFVFLSICIAALADTYPKNPKVDILNYQFQLQLSDATDEIRCATTIEFKVQPGVEFLRLDLVKATSQMNGMTVSEVTSQGQPLKFVHEGDELKIFLLKASSVVQQMSIEITYSGTPASGLKIAPNKHGDRTFFSDNWPDKGRHWLPIVDHPYDKATCEFIVTAPAHYQVVSNGIRIEETDLPNGNRLTHWKQSVPIASWLYTLGVARFAVQKVDEFDHKSIETWVYPQDRVAGFYDFAIPTRQVLEFYSQYVGPFAYEKLANIQSNSVSGGMEAASAILYSENSVVGDRNERWRNVVIHEVAHQWFGNAVTESDWDDVWLSEGFATYFTSLYIEHAYGRDAFIKEMMSSKQTVEKFEARNPNYRIVHDNLSDMSKVTSSHTYQKGSWILHMLRGMLGDDNFCKGIRSYYQKYYNGNATTADFRHEMELASGQNLEVFFDQWLYKPGPFKLDGTWQYNARTKEVSIVLQQTGSEGNYFQMPVQLEVRFKQAGAVKQVIPIAGKAKTYTIAVTEEPVEVILDPDHWVLMTARLERK